MASIADELRAKRTPTVYPETFQGKPIRVECPDYVVHPFMTGHRCSKCHDRDWILTDAGQAMYDMFLEMKKAKPLFKQLLEES